MEDHKGVEWAWSFTYSELAEGGPFKSREEALADAQRNSGSEEVVLGHAVWPDPGDYVTTDLDWFLERMDDTVADEDYRRGDGEGSNAVLFETKDRKGAEEDLVHILQDWARKWVKSKWWIFEEVEKIKLVATRGVGSND